MNLVALDQDDDHYVDDVLSGSPGEHLTLLSGPTHGRPVRRIQVIDSLDLLKECQPGALVCVMRHCTDGATGYELDVAIRYAASRELSGLILLGRSSVPSTVKQLAERAGLALMGYPASEDLVALLRALDRIVTGGPAASLERAVFTLARLKGIDGTADFELLLHESEAALDEKLQLTWIRPESGVAEPVVVGGHEIGWILVEGDVDVAVALALPAIAAALSRAYEGDLAAEQARGELLGALLAADDHARVALAGRARAAGLAVDDHHLAAAICADEGDASDHPPDTKVRRRWQLLTHILARQLLGGHLGKWTIAAFNTEVVLVASSTSGETLSPTQLKAATLQLMDALANEYESLRFYGGLGGVAGGVEGLVSSTFEARSSASSARAAGMAGRIAELNATGLGHILGQIYSSPTSRRALDDLLAPLDNLSARQQQTTLDTLSAYLDAQGSNQRAARALNLHANAVAYRMAKIKQLLGVDLDDPDDRFAVHVACRVRLLHSDS